MKKLEINKCSNQNFDEAMLMFKQMCLGGGPLAPGALQPAAFELRRRPSKPPLPSSRAGSAAAAAAAAQHEGMRCVVRLGREGVRRSSVDGKGNEVRGRTYGTCSTVMT